MDFTLKNILLPTFIISLSLLILFLQFPQYREYKTIQLEIIFKTNYYSFPKSSQDSAEFEAWLQEKQRLNRNIKKVCRERNIQIKIGGPSFMYIKPTNILFCLNPKVKLKRSIEIYLTDKEIQVGTTTWISYFLQLSGLCGHGHGQHCPIY